jgi:hypothetical protein
MGNRRRLPFFTGEEHATLTIASLIQMSVPAAADGGDDDDDDET